MEGKKEEQKERMGGKYREGRLEWKEDQKKRREVRKAKIGKDS